MTLRQTFKRLCSAYGPLHSVADFFDCSPSAIERRCNSGTSVSVENHILPLEDDLAQFPWTINRMRHAMQAMNNPKTRDAIDHLHEGIMMLEKAAPEHFGGDQ